MKLNIRKLLIAFVLLLSMQMSYSQLGFSHEVGVIAGPVAYKSDFGERSDFDTNAGNTGIGIGLVYYMNFDYLTNYYYWSKNNYFTDHFKVRAELNWNKTKLEHFGEWVDPDKVSDDAERLRGHSGEAQNWGMGLQLEYYPISIKAFSQGVYSFTPFVSLGMHYVGFRPGAYTNYISSDPLNPNDIGNIDDPNNFYSRWDAGSINDQSHSDWSAVASVGTRYKLTILSDLMVDLRFQYFFSDKTDGLDHQLDSNKTNDWLAWLNFGYIYYFD